MTKLIGRECWYAGATLKHGKITRHNIEQGHVSFETDMGDTDHVHVDSVILDREKAINECLENVQYWQRKANELEGEQA